MTLLFAIATFPCAKTAEGCGFFGGEPEKPKPRRGNVLLGHLAEVPAVHHRRFSRAKFSIAAATFADCSMCG
jgi:hypothetical protein